MKKLNNLRLTALILLLATIVSAQEAPAEDLEAKKAKLQENAVEYLRDTASEINILRTVENRISFSSELANLMWFHDEKEARKMFSGVADSFIQLLTESNARVTALGGMQDESEMFGGFRMAPDERREAIRKVFKAMAVREQVALAIAEHDAQLAYDFVIRTGSAITDERISERFTSQNEGLERKILERMSVQDPEKSLEFARRSLKRGFKPEHLEIAKKVYLKEPDAAIAFAEEIVSKVRSEAAPERESISHMYLVLSSGAAPVGGDKAADGAASNEKALIKKETLADLADLFAGNLLRAEDFETWMIDDYVSEIEKYSPSQARRVEAKYAEEEDEADAASDAKARVEDLMRDAGVGTPSPAEQAAEAKKKEQREFMEELSAFGNNELTKEQKAQFIAKARRIVGEMNDPTLKIAALATLAAQIKILGDGDLAAEIMREANALVNPNPKNFLDYMLTWALITGYSQVAPDEAFPLVEDAIYRLNDTIGAAVKVAEFIDVQGDFVIDGEVQVGAFGGSMVRSAVGMLGSSGSVLKNLAMSDFDRTKALADRFEKPEVRILARFMVLRSVLLTDQSKDLGFID